MTTPRYPQQACAAGSKVRRDASSSLYAGDSDNAWIVNFNNGNANYNYRDNNNGFVRAVRSVAPASPGECHGAGAQIPLRDLYAAWKAARAKKVASRDQLAFDARMLDGLFNLQQRLQAGTWEPSPTTCFIARRPKAREIHAPAFSDRVVHHWLVPQLEAIYEPTFIHDSYSNRPGKGTHAAVERLKTFVRQVHSGQGGGWYLQLDVSRFFYCIHRPTLWRMIKARMQRHNMSESAMHAVHALLRRSPIEYGVRACYTEAERALVPPGKRLENASPGCALPIGNLSSQFFANVYLDKLDQFVKHTLKIPRYVRYVDDFVIVHHSREQLQQWQRQIETFLREQLRLELKAEQKLQPLTDGIDFLGYVIHPTHTRVRRRVISHANESLAAWGNRHVNGDTAHVTPEALRTLNNTWASYQGHMRHAHAWNLQQQFYRRYPWLESLTRVRRRFGVRDEGRHFEIRVKT